MKLKTRSSAKKRIKVTKSGKLIAQKACKNHLLSDKSSRAKGRNKYGAAVSATNTQMLSRAIPYSI